MKKTKVFLIGHFDKDNFNEIHWLINKHHPNIETISHINFIKDISTIKGNLDDMLLELIDDCESVILLHNWYKDELQKKLQKKAIEQNKTIYIEDEILNNTIED